jgi:hypothetical protein
MIMRNRRATSGAGAAGVAVLLGLLGGGSALAQQSAPPPHAAPRPDQLEPGVDTSKSAPAEASPSASSAAPPAPAARPSAPPAAAPGAAAPAASPRAAAPASKSGAAASPPAGKKGADRLELDTTAVKGNRELPRVMYVVPWKRSDLGDLVGRPVNSLLDEVLQPVDRDVFKRENRYYDALKPDATVPK